MKRAHVFLLQRLTTVMVKDCSGVMFIIFTVIPFLYLSKILYLVNGKQIIRIALIFPFASRKILPHGR